MRLSPAAAAASTVCDQLLVFSCAAPQPYRDDSDARYTDTAITRPGITVRGWMSRYTLQVDHFRDGHSMQSLAPPTDNWTQQQQEIWAIAHETRDSMSFSSYAGCLGLSPVISAKIHSLCAPQPKIAKNSRRPLFWGFIITGHGLNDYRYTETVRKAESWRDLTSRNRCRPTSL